MVSAFKGKIKCLKSFLATCADCPAQIQTHDLTREQFISYLQKTHGWVRWAHSEWVCEDCKRVRKKEKSKIQASAKIIAVNGMPVQDAIRGRCNGEPGTFFCHQISGRQFFISDKHAQKHPGIFVRVNT